MSLRKLSSQSGNSSRSGVLAAMLRNCSHCSAKLATSAVARGSASMRRTCASSIVGSRSRPASAAVEQLVVGMLLQRNSASRDASVEVVDAVDAARRGRRPVDAAEQELGPAQDSRERELDPAFEVAPAAAALLVELEQRREIAPP